MLHWLSVTSGKSVGRRYQLTDGTGTVGRGVTNSVQIIDSEVSRVHCRYEIDKERVQLIDLESANGTSVNHVPVKRCELREGDVIQFGTTTVRYDVSYPAVDKTVVSNKADPNRSGRATAATARSLPASNELAVDPDAIPELSEGLYVQHPSAELDSDEQTDSARRMIQVSSDLNFMYLASMATSSHASRNAMLDQVVKLIFEWIAADRACILLRDENASSLTIQVFRHRRPGGDNSKLQLSQSILNYVRKKRVGILTSNATDDRRLDGNMSIKKIGTQEAICVPIQGRDEILGLIYVDTLQSIGDAGVPRFNEDHLKLMIAIAHQIGFALENDSYFSALLEKERLAAVGETVASLSHHIKNILQNVNGGSHLIEQGFQGDSLDMIRTGWQIVKRNQNEVSTLVNNMLILSSDYDPVFELADLNGVLADVLKHVQPQLAKYKVECIWEPVNPAENFYFHCDGIRSALLNIINSSVSACCEVAAGRIKLDVHRAGVDAIRISVSDNGLPIPDHSSSSIFSSLEMNPALHTNRVELAVSRKLVQGHGGDIILEQPSAGGNLFAINLPTDPRS